MAKLIHAAQLAHIKANNTLWASNAYTALAQSALIFTDDGHIVVKGTDYKVALANNAEGSSAGQRRLWNDGGTLKLTDSALFTYVGPKIDKVKTEELGVSSTIYLTGVGTAPTNSNPVTDYLKAKSSVYIETDNSGNATLVAPAVTVVGGASSLVLGSKTLLQYLTEQISQGLQTNDAMVFAGTLKVSGTDLVFVSHNANLNYGTGVTITDGTTKLSQITNYSAGWTFKIVTSAGTPTGFDALELGDMIIATTNSGGTYSAGHFSVVQANIDGAVTAANNLTANGIVLGNGTKTVKILTTDATAGYLKPNGSSAPSWATFGTLTLDGTTTDFTFNPATSKTLKIGAGLDITSAGDPAVYTIGHSNSVTAQTTAALKKFKFDTQGHITGVADVSKLTLKAQDSSGNAIAASGVSNKTYDGSAAVDFVLKAGTNITLAQATSGVIEISSSYTNTWRPVEGFLLSGSALASAASSIGTRTLRFASTFAYKETSSGGTTYADLDLVWADVDASGNITYSV